MAAKKKTRRRAAPRRRRTKPSGGGAGQKALLALAGIVLVLCVASVTQGFFLRNKPDGVRFRVDVLNGTGKAGLAHAVKRSLHRKGIDVIEVGNADRFDYKESVIIRRREGVDVEALGRNLGCDNIVTQLRKRSLSDATLILGADYRELNLDWELESDLLE